MQGGVGNGMKVGEGINQTTFIHKPWTQRTMWGLTRGWENLRLGEGGEGKKSGKNCNSLHDNNKIKHYFKNNKCRSNKGICNCSTKFHL